MICPFWGPNFENTGAISELSEEPQNMIFDPILTGIIITPAKNLYFYLILTAVKRGRNLRLSDWRNYYPSQNGVNIIFFSAFLHFSPL